MASCQTPRSHPVDPVPLAPRTLRWGWGWALVKGCWEAVVGPRGSRSPASVAVRLREGWGASILPELSASPNRPFTSTSRCKPEGLGDGLDEHFLVGLSDEALHHGNKDDEEHERCKVAGGLVVQVRLEVKAQGNTGPLDAVDGVPAEGDVGALPQDRAVQDDAPQLRAPKPPHALNSIPAPLLVTARGTTVFNKPRREVRPSGRGVPQTECRGHGQQTQRHQRQQQPVMRAPLVAAVARRRRVDPLLLSSSLSPLMQYTVPLNASLCNPLALGKGLQGQGRCMDRDRGGGVRPRLCERY